MSGVALIAHQEFQAALQAARRRAFERFTRSVALSIPGVRGASLATMRRRVQYGGRKGRRAARRLLAAGIRP